MKKLMLFVILLWLSACTKDPNFQSEGTIIGQDYRKCYCCGGWFIEIENDTLRANLSSDVLQELNLYDATLPLPVRLDWEKQERPCFGDEIIVTRIERR